MMKSIFKYLFFTVLLSTLLCVFIFPYVDNTFSFGIYIVGSIFYLVILFDKKLLRDLKKYLSVRKRVREIDYYRDKLDEYSPLMCAKLMANRILTKDSVTAMILYLREKGYINENGEKIKEDSLMMKHEIFFIDNSKFIFYDLYNKTNSKYNDEYSLCEYLQLLVDEDLLTNGLISETTVVKKNSITTLADALPFLYIMFTIIAFSRFDISMSFSSLNVLKCLFISFSIIWITIFIAYIILKLRLRSIQTAKGYDYTVKLLSQKRFLSDFTVISFRSLKEESLWEYYMRAAILYDLKGLLDKDASEFYRSVTKAIGYDDTRYYDSTNKLTEILTFIMVYGPWLLIMIFNGDVLFTMLLSNFILLPFIYLMLIRLNYKS